MYGVEAYLPQLLESLSAQEPGEFSLEVLFIDDGSPDQSGEIAQTWLDQSGMCGRVIRQANSGVSAARNRGLEEADGEWVTFPDPDDMLAVDYFQQVAAFIEADQGRSSLVSARMLRLLEPDPTPHDVHALRFRFMAGNRRVSMTRYPDFFQLNVASGFFRRKDLLHRGVRFRTGLHASEDALFVAEFLLREKGEPVIGLVSEAKYIYRRRAARDSAVDKFRDDAQSYIGRFKDGYAALMADAAAAGVPGWLQSMFLYECQWILPVQLTSHGYADVLTEEEREEVLDALASCARYVGEDRLFEYDATALPLESRLLLQLLAGRSIPSWVGAYRDRDGSVDVPLAAGSRVEVHTKDGAIDPQHAGFVVPDYFGQQLLVHWRGSIPRGARIFVDGVPRRVIHRRWIDTPAQQRDRHRRRELNVAKNAIPSREHEVRVWKPIPGPGGDRATRVRWRLSLLRRRLARLARKVRRLD